METKINTTKPELNKLTSFRQALYKCFTRAADALFELLDALLCSPGLLSLPELSCAPVFRRQWPSVYEALQNGQLDRDQLLKHCVEILPANPRPLLVGDHTAWGRPQARTLNNRTFEHQPTPIKGQKPITIGHGYSTLGVGPDVREYKVVEHALKSIGMVEEHFVLMSNNPVKMARLKAMGINIEEMLCFEYKGWVEQSELRRRYLEEKARFLGHYTI